MNSNENISAHLLVLDGKNSDKWVKQMKVIFGFRDVLEIVNNGVEVLPTNPTDVQRIAHKEVKKKDCKALFYIHQCMDNKVFEKIADAESSKEVCNTLTTRKLQIATLLLRPLPCNYLKMNICNGCCDCLEQLSQLFFVK